MISTAVGISAHSLPLMSVGTRLEATSLHRVGGSAHFRAPARPPLARQKATPQAPRPWAAAPSCDDRRGRGWPDGGWVVAATIRSPVGSRLVAPGPVMWYSTRVVTVLSLVGPALPRQAARKYTTSAENRTARSQAGVGNRHCPICYAVPHTAYLGSVSSSGSLCGGWSARSCADVWVESSSFERRRSSAMPMLSMKTKKPMKPMFAIVAITDDAGLSSPSHPANPPTSRPSHPIHRCSTRVVRMATAYRGTTTPKLRKLP